MPTTPPPPKLMILDTASLYFRAFYGIPDSIRTPDGRPVNAVRGLLDFISYLVDEYRPTHLVCAWDNDWRPAWRVALVPTYKAHRVAEAGQDSIAEMSASAATAAEESPDGLSHQVPMIIAVLDALGIAIVGADEHEADDVIGTLAATATMPTEVVTGDRDLFQVVDDQRQVRVLYVAKGVQKHERVDAAWLQAKYGVGPGDYVAFATLRGDPSDGLPGVPGIGEKTAASLLRAHGDLEGILAAASDSPDGGRSKVAPGVRSKLAAAIDYLAVAPEVVSVVPDLDLGVRAEDLVLPTEPAHPRVFARLREEYNLGGAGERVLAALARPRSS